MLSQRRFDGKVEVIGAGGQCLRFHLGEDGLQPRGRGVVLQRNRHQPEVRADQVDGQVVGAGETDGGDEVSGRGRIDRVVSPGRGDRRNVGP